MWTVLGIIGFIFLALVGLVFIILGSINPKWAMMKSRGPVYAIFAPILAIGVIGPIVMIVMAIMNAEPTASEEIESVEEPPIEEEEPPMDSETPPLEEEDPLELDEEEENFDEEEVASRDNPAYPGEMITFVLEHYTYGLMEVDVTLLDTIRGEEAWEMIEEADEYNEPPEDGMEYFIAYFDIDLNQIEEDPFNLSSFEFDLVSSEGNVYNDDTYVTGLDDPIDADLYEGAGSEGHVVFQVDEDDPSPYVVFLRDLDGVWYQTEEGADIDLETEESV
ncbi:DUF4352 domain-containing protein [Salicibibacter cibi]|uniref:DUF4352 domain-containing protein n=1 Tax=Salicibibacter cibi TaxID=2743001 RepID=A0A7T6ZD78_9BACI|nr:DUF4352 domain-containing protein [Salicibibacter cibi]QQK81376.1 DUF4352 domain-containing protein [Salicibibacter cibi]